MKSGLLFIGIIALLLAGCSNSNIMARNEGEGIRKGYTDQALTQLDRRYQTSLRDIYSRYRAAGIDIYQEGLGFTKLSDNRGHDSYYLMILTRPKQITFDVNKSTPDQRFETVFQNYFQQALRFAKREDVEKEGIDGLAFGVYWPVRDFYQCNTYGGFLEYMVVYMKKADFFNLLDGTATLADIATTNETVASLGLKPPTSIKLIDQ